MYQCTYTMYVILLMDEWKWLEQQSIHGSHMNNSYLSFFEKKTI
jgi:hypothetical protein